MPKKIPHTIFAVCAWVGYVCWMLGICWLSSKPGDEIQSPLFEIPYGDKLVHAIAFAVGGGLVALALRSSSAWSWRRIAVVAIVCVVLFGMADEWHQLYTPRRSGGDPFDWIADAVGGTIGAFLAMPIHERLRHFIAR